MIVSLAEFNTYSGNNETSVEVDALKTSMLMSAEQVVIDYLGYNPTSSQRTDVVSGIGSNRLYLYAQGISALTSVSINGSPVAVNTLTIVDGRYLMSTDYAPIFCRGIDNIVVRYTAGFSDNSNEMGLIKTTIKRIASLMLQETNGNIGLTSRTFGDQNRSYLNYTNYDKYLRPLDSLCVVRL